MRLAFLPNMHTWETNTSFPHLLKVCTTSTLTCCWQSRSMTCIKEKQCHAKQYEGRQKAACGGRKSRAGRTLTVGTTHKASTHLHFVSREDVFVKALKELLLHLWRGDDQGVALVYEHGANIQSSCGGVHKHLHTQSWKSLYFIHIFFLLSSCCLGPTA